MKRVHMIFEGEYFDRKIVKIFADEDKAKVYVNEMGPVSNHLDIQTIIIPDKYIICDGDIIKEAITGRRIE